MPRKKIQHGLPLIRLDAHHKTVGGIHRQLALPACQQVGAHQRQQQQRHAAKTERHDLQRHATPVPREVVENLPPARGGNPCIARQPLQQRPCQQAKHQQPRQQAAQYRQAQLERSRLPQKQPCQHQRGETVAQPNAGLRRTQLAAYHA